MSHNKQTPRILIADDHPHGVELLEAFLAETDYEVRAATDGDQTLRLAHEWHPDVILLDVMMPKFSGFEVCKRLKADTKTKGIGIIMVTALDQPSDIERAVEVGTDDFLTKPINKHDLLNRVRSLLASRSATSELGKALAYIDAVQNPAGE
jgi:DNA-binding response OmpR family regulator